jgi:hypothetical protein
MNIFTKEGRSRAFFIISMLIAKVAAIGSLIVAGYEMYIRWTLNQNFTFLGGWELEAFTLAGFGLLLGLNYINRAHKD